MKTTLVRLAQALSLLAALALQPVAAHEMSMAELDVRQISANEFIWQWSASGERPPAQELTPKWPQGCAVDGNLLRCGPEGLSGTMSIDGVGDAYTAALMRVHWIDGQSRVYTMTAAQPKVRLFGSADDRRGMGEIAYAYTVLGIEHILGGFDHLLFVLGLLFLVGFNRQLLWTITAFTIAHSITLGLSALDLLALRSPPVDAAVALSIVLVASEALSHRQTLARRWPALVAFLFGLVHGLGFAGGLKQIGLPENHLLVALLTFNVGVEVGQLLLIAAAWALWRWLGQMRWTLQARAPALYAMGGVAAYWSWGRVAALFA